MCGKGSVNVQSGLYSSYAHGLTSGINKGSEIQIYNNQCDYISSLIYQYGGRVVKALDLSSNGRMSAWVRTPPVLKMLFSFLNVMIHVTGLIILYIAHPLQFN